MAWQLIALVDFAGTQVQLPGLIRSFPEICNSCSRGSDAHSLAPRSPGTHLLVGDRSPILQRTACWSWFSFYHWSQRSNSGHQAWLYGRRYLYPLNHLGSLSNKMTVKPTNQPHRNPGVILLSQLCSVLVAMVASAGTSC